MTLTTIARPFAAAAFATLIAAGAAPLAAQQTLTLQEAIQLAQQRGAQASAARATRDAALYRNRAFSSRLLPQLSVNGNLPQYNSSIVLAPQPDGSNLYLPQEQTNGTLNLRLSQKLPVTGGDLFVTSSLASLARSGQARTWASTPISITLRQELFRPNVTGWDRREQNVRTTRDERAYLEAQEQVALATTELFFNVYVALRALENARTNAAVNDTLYRLNTGRIEVGRIGENDLLQSELALLRSRAAVDAARLAYDRARAALRIAINVPRDLQFDVVVTADVPSYEPDTARAVEQALRNRSTVSDVELSDVQARRRVNDARLSNGPGASLQASFGYNATGDSIALAYRNLLEARQFTLAVSMPLWQWGAHGEDVRAAEADRSRVTSLNENTMENLELDARFAALQLALARRNVAVAAKADSVAGRRFEVAYNRYGIGRITIDNLYIAQNEKDQAVTQFAESLRGYWRAHYQLRLTTLFDFSTGQPIH